MLNTISAFRTKDYRVFYAAPYFSIDIEREIRWHEKYIKELREHSLMPSKFHEKHLHDHLDRETKLRYFKEHVMDSLPFHQRILEEHKHRLKTILGLVAKKRYKKLVSISMKLKAVPEFFIYDKIAKKGFFVALKQDPDLKRWIKTVKKQRLADVMLLDPKAEIQ